MKAALAVMTLPYSDAYFLSAYPRECTETFQAGHQAAFEFFGGVPVRTSYDNTSIAVKKVVGRDASSPGVLAPGEPLPLRRTTSAGWAGETRRATSRPTSAIARRNLLVPVPSFASFAALNEYLAAACYADLFRRVRGKPETKAERLEDDRAAMLGLPADASRSAGSSRAGRTRSRSCASTATTTRCRPPSPITTSPASAGSTRSASSAAPTWWPPIPAGGTKRASFFDPRHYLALLERKPGAFDFARPLEGWDLPECLLTLRRRLEADLGHAGHPGVHQGAAPVGARDHG